MTAFKLTGFLDVCIFCGGKHQSCDMYYDASDTNSYAIPEERQLMNKRVLLRFTWSTQGLGARMTQVNWTGGNQYRRLQEDYRTMTLLIPDRDKPNKIDLVWCLPIERPKWNKWFDLATKFKTRVPAEHGGGVMYINRMEGKKVRTVLMLPVKGQTDDDVMTACAYLRMVKQLDCRMYIVRCAEPFESTSSMSSAQIANRVAGIDYRQLESIKDEDLKGKVKP